MHSIERLSSKNMSAYCFHIFLKPILQHTHFYFQSNENMKNCYLHLWGVLLWVGTKFLRSTSGHFYENIQASSHRSPLFLRGGICCASINYLVLHKITFSNWRGTNLSYLFYFFHSLPSKRRRFPKLLAVMWPNIPKISMVEK